MGCARTTTHKNKLNTSNVEYVADEIAAHNQKQNLLTVASNKWKPTGLCSTNTPKDIYAKVKWSSLLTATIHQLLKPMWKLLEPNSVF